MPDSGGGRSERSISRPGSRLFSPPNSRGVAMKWLYVCEYVQSLVVVLHVVYMWNSCISEAIFSGLASCVFVRVIIQNVALFENRSGGVFVRYAFTLLCPWMYEQWV